MEIYPSIATLLFYPTKICLVFFFPFLFGFEFMNYLYYFFFLFTLIGYIYFLFQNYQILYFLLQFVVVQQGFHLFYSQVVFELCLYVCYQIKLIFLNSKIFMFLFLIFIFVVSNIIDVGYKNVIIRQPISQKRIICVRYTKLFFCKFYIIKWIIYI